MNNIDKPLIIELAVERALFHKYIEIERAAIKDRELQAELTRHVINKLEGELRDTVKPPKDWMINVINTGGTELRTFKVVYEREAGMVSPLNAADQSSLDKIRFVLASHGFKVDLPVIEYFKIIQHFTAEV